MMGLELNEIITKIREKTQLSEEEVRLQITKKRDKLSGLVSEEGAAHILANELGVDVMESIRKQGLKINKLKPGMRVGVLAKVVKLYEVRSFKRGDQDAKVGSFLVGDDSGLVRIVMWDENHVAKMESGEIKEGTIVKVENGAVRENNGYTEMHLGNYSNIETNPEGVGEINVIEKGNMVGGAGTGELKITKLNEASIGDNISVYGTVVQLYDPRFYEGCSECGKKVVDGKCPNHPEGTPKKIPILNFFLDDGHEGIRATAFRDQASKVLGIEDSVLESFADNPGGFEEVKQQVLGTQKVFSGRVNSNEMYKRKEFMVSNVPQVDTADILAKFIN